MVQYSTAQCVMYPPLAEIIRWMVVIADEELFFQFSYRKLGIKDVDKRLHTTVNTKISVNLFCSKLGIKLLGVCNTLNSSPDNFSKIRMAHRYRSKMISEVFLIWKMRDNSVFHYLSSIMRLYCQCTVRISNTPWRQLWRHLSCQHFIYRGPSLCCPVSLFYDP